MPATKPRVIRDSQSVGTVEKSAVKSAVRKVTNGKVAKRPSSYESAPALRRKK